MTDSSHRDIGLQLREQVIPNASARYGLVVGLTTYRDARLNLRCARADAEAMYRLMIDPTCGLFLPENVTLLLDEQATRNSIWKALSTLRRRCGEEDTCWIYYAGHGAPEGKDFYWVTYDADVDDLYGTALSSARELQSALAELKADRLITFLDCCYAAAMALMRNPLRKLVPPEQVMQAFAGKGRLAFCSSDGKETSVELPERGHGAFTYFLESGLRGEADTAGQGVVTVERLWEYLRDKVAAISREVGKPQTPILDGKMSHDIALTLNPSAAGFKKGIANAIIARCGVGPDKLTTDEAEFCLEVLKNGPRGDDERELAADFESLASGRLPLRTFKRLVRAARGPDRAPVAVALNSLPWVSATAGWGIIQLNRSIEGNPITLRGTVYANGIGTHTASTIVYNLAGAYTTFICDVGIDDETNGRGSVDFQVIGDGKVLYDSGILTGTSPVAHINISVTRVQQLSLVATNGIPNNIDHDHADWAGAKLLITPHRQAPPSAPSNLTATITAIGKVNLAWANTANNQTAVQIERSTDGANFTTVATVGAGMTTFSDSLANFNATYFYAVQAINATGPSGNSNVVFITTPVAPNVYLSVFSPINATVGWGTLNFNQSIEGNPITLRGAVYCSGIGTHAPSTIVYNIGANYTTFVSDVGVDDETNGQGAIHFQIYGDGTLLYDSGVLTGTHPAAHVCINVTGVQQLTLIANPGVAETIDFDHAAWAGAVLLNTPVVSNATAAERIVREAARQFVAQRPTWDDPGWREFLAEVRIQVTAAVMSNDEIGTLLEAEASAERNRREELSRQNRIANLLAAARANDSPAKAIDVIPLLDQLLAIDPGHAEALMLKRKLAGFAREFTNSIGMKFVRIEPGEFLMGSPANEPDRNMDETQHKVTLTKAFYMAAYLVTQRHWKAVMGNDPSHFKGEEHPVEYVSWNDAVEFCQKLGNTDGRRYRLPTEAEWEYACRAGTTAQFNTGDGERSVDEAGWYRSNAMSKWQTHPVGQKKPNAWGLYDMHGNVCEWCSDYYGPYADGDTVDPTGPCSASHRIARRVSFQRPRQLSFRQPQPRQARLSAKL